jgi:hypothetical protein
MKSKAKELKWKTREQFTQRLYIARARHNFLFSKDTYFQRPTFSPNRDFYSLALSIYSHLLYAFDGQTFNVRTAKMVAWRKDANKQKRQANKNLKQQVVKLSRSQSANANLRVANEDRKTTSVAAR